MLFCFLLIVIVLFDAKLADADCRESFNRSPGKISLSSTDKRNIDGRQLSCVYFIRAPEDCVISLNFTSVYGFTNLQESCEPGLKISEISNSSEIVMHVLCPGHHHTFPKVFQSTSHQIKITYVWIPKHYSGFSLHFYFHKRIPYIVKSSSSSSATPLLPSSSSSSGSTIQILIIVITVALFVGIVTCVVSHYKMGARSWSEQRRHRQQNSNLSTSTDSSDLSSSSSAYHSHHNTLHHPFSSVLYVPQSSGGRRLIASTDDSHIQLQNVSQHELDANYPTSIAMPDGEETPYGSWRNFRIRNTEQQSEIYRECVKPPPNKTVFDGASSPLYHAKSASLFNSKKSGRLASSHLATKDNKSPLVMRCRSMDISTGTTKNSSSIGASPPVNSCSLLLVPGVATKHDRCKSEITSGRQQQQQQQSPPLRQQSILEQNSPLLGPLTSSCSVVTNSSTLTVTPCATGNQQAVIDPPPDYSEVVANPNLYQTTTSSDQNIFSKFNRQL